MLQSASIVSKNDCGDSDAMTTCVVFTPNLRLRMYSPCLVPSPSTELTERRRQVICSSMCEKGEYGAPYKLLLDSRPLRTLNSIYP